MKKLISFGLALAMILSLFTATCFATDAILDSEECASGPTGSRPARAEVIAEWQATHDESAELAALEMVPVPVATNATWINIPHFLYYAQIKKDSCGATAVRMALYGLTRSAPSEETIREGCKWESGVGTYMDNCAAYLNEAQDIYTYEDMYTRHTLLFNTNLYNAINAGAPPIVGIAISTEEGWYYNTSGHAITIQGVMSDKSEYKIADPWGGYVNRQDWKQYEKPSDKLFLAYDVNQGYIA